MGGGYDGNGTLVLGRIPSAEESGAVWNFNWDEVYAGGRGRDVFLGPVGSPPAWGMNWDEDQGAGEYPNAYFFYLPRLCNHCTRPSCVEACPNGALYKRAEDGLVLRDEDRCRGAQECIRACPYKKIHFNVARQVSQHCIGCFPRLEKGVAPACVRQCAGRAAFVGFIDDEGSAVHRLAPLAVALRCIRSEHGAQRVLRATASPWRLRPDGSADESGGASPPPISSRCSGRRRPGAPHAGDRDRPAPGGQASELVDTLIAYEWKTMLGRSRATRRS
jgi:Fe-S-cluster-containing dehydrogenase component